MFRSIHCDEFAAAVEQVRSAFASSGLDVRGVCESPIHGAKGNVEYLMLGVRGA